LGVEEWRIPVGRAETNRKGEGEEEGVADDDCGNNTRKEKEGRRDGRGGTRIGTRRKNWEGRVHKSTSERGGCEGVTRGPTGRQRRDRNECRRGQKGQTREACRHTDRQNG
jgi:hypothetical protein